ncbi:CRE-NHR-170 protein [Caenorhabditis remanei]|uniref:CRE-NHR-170 protein n=1 Tax=Caenorhabditis remanei TaxID=31234 RepID=E3N843_CAERE|nr:CRE-NHR-170 protein [Caenorhabditis remanei]
MNAPTSSAEMTYFNVKCKICLKTGHGLHFGIETCRACAAFFRRTVVLNRKYKCSKRSGKCEIGAADEKLMCKFCRFKKCIDLGMTTENVRTDQVIKDDEDSQDSSPIASVSSTVSLQMTSSQPECEIGNRVEYSVINPKTRAPAMLIDVNAIIKKSRAILETYFLPDEDSISHLNPLQRMAHSLRKIREKQNWNPEFFVNIKFYEMFSWWEVQMRDTASWLMHSDEFRKLPGHERIAIFKIVWAVWRRFERYTMTAEIFGQRCYDEKILLHSHDSAARLGSYYIDYSNVSDHGFERFNNVFGGKMIQYYDIIVKPFFELKLTETEITFILCQIIWNYAGRRLQGQTQAAAERFLEQISNNLHQYYEEEYEEWTSRSLEGVESSVEESSRSPDGSVVEKKKNYASRLAKMMQIVNQMLNIQLKREDTMDIAMLFDMFNIVFTEPEFFRV